MYYVKLLSFVGPEGSHDSASANALCNQDLGFSRRYNPEDIFLRLGVVYVRNAQIETTKYFSLDLKRLECWKFLKVFIRYVVYINTKYEFVRSQ